MLPAYQTEDILPIISSTDPAAKGEHRQVWIHGDVVIKAADDVKYNLKEFCNYQRVMEECEPFLGRELVGMWTSMSLRLPDMNMCGEYIIAQRAPGVILHCLKEGKSGLWCDLDKYACDHCKIISDVERLAFHYLDLADIHDGNFLWDEGTRTAWIIDMDM